MASIINALTGALGGLAGRGVSITSSMAPSITSRPGSTLSGAEVQALLSKLSTYSAADMHRTQPNLRAVVDFRARNVAQLGLHLFRPVDEGRERDRDSVAAKLLASPSRAQTGYQLIYSLVADIDLYDEAFWVVVNRGGDDWAIRPIPVAAITERRGSEWAGTFEIEVAGGDDDAITITGDQLVHFRGYSPDYGSAGTSPVEALRDTLMEQIAAQHYRLSVWKNGGMVSSYISRPSGAPRWSEEAAKRFREDMRAFRSGGSRAGGMPLLEDGMKVEAGALNSKEQQYVEAAQLALATVARAYHVSPAMLGETGGVTYANMREFRKSLYGETLGPILRMIEDHLNTRLLPMLGVDDGSYFEFNVKEKLRGAFEEEAKVLSTATGAGAWMTINEARATQNLKPVEGGDAVLQPLNMAPLGETPVEGADALEAGARAALGMGSKAAPAVVVGGEDEGRPDRVAELIATHARRQEVAVIAARGRKADAKWWDGARWDRELAADLTTLAKVITAEVGGGVAAQLGAPGAYRLDETVRFLEAVAESRAHMLNEGTRAALERAIGSDDPDALAHVFEDLRGARGAMWGTSIAAALASFATVEAGKQVDRGTGTTTKTWLVRSNNPRHTHAAMSGQTVPIGEKFSNGSSWPGDSASLPVGEVAGCKCGVEISHTREA